MCGLSFSSLAVSQQLCRFVRIMFWKLQCTPKPHYFASHVVTVYKNQNTFLSVFAIQFWMSAVALHSLGEKVTITKMCIETSLFRHIILCTYTKAVVFHWMSAGNYIWHVTQSELYYFFTYPCFFSFMLRDIRQ